MISELEMIGQHEVLKNTLRFKMGEDSHLGVGTVEIEYVNKAFSGAEITLPENFPIRLYELKNLIMEIEEAVKDTIGVLARGKVCEICLSALPDDPLDNF